MATLETHQSKQREARKTSFRQQALQGNSGSRESPKKQSHQHPKAKTTRHEQKGKLGEMGPTLNKYPPKKVWKGCVVWGLEGARLTLDLPTKT